MLSVHENNTIPTALTNITKKKKKQKTTSIQIKKNEATREQKRKNETLDQKEKCLK